MKRTKTKSFPKIVKPNQIKEINKYVAGIDIGSQEHYVAVSPELTDEFVKSFGAFTEDLRAISQWLISLGITSVAMESTGVYWIPIYDVLQEAGLEVLLVNAKYIKNVTGRKSDVIDCQWIQQLHSFGLLRGSFRPDDQTCALRGVMRQRDAIIKTMSQVKLRMQKALDQMNIHLHHVISDITGDLGLKILTNIVEGNHDPKSLASMRTNQYKASLETFEKSLEGNYRKELILSLKQGLDSYAFAQKQLQECDAMAENILKEMSPAINDPELIVVDTEDDTENNAKDGSKRGRPKKIANKKVVQKERKAKRRKNELFFDAAHYLKNLVGVDLTAIPGLDANSALKLISEIGTDMSRWSSAKHFASWLGLAPGTKISGGKILSAKTKPCQNRAATILRIAAFVLGRSPSALGAFLRKKKAQLDAPEAITATAHKLAKIVYTMIKERKEFQDLGAEFYEKQYQERVMKKLKKTAAFFGYSLVENVSTIIQNVAPNIVTVGGA